MGKRSKQFEEKTLSGKCVICEEDIEIDFYMDPGDLITCDECGSDYILKSRNPVRLFLIEEDDEDDDDEDYFDDEGCYRE